MMNKDERYSLTDLLLPFVGNYARQMFYNPEFCNNFDNNLMIQAMQHHFLRYQFLCILNNLFGGSNPHEKIKEIICHDVNDPNSVPNMNLYFNTEKGQWTFKRTSEAKNDILYILIQDSNFIVVLRLDKVNSKIEVYLHKL